MKAEEVWLFVAIAAKHHLNLVKSDTKQAVLNGEIGQDNIYVHPLDWWREHVQQGYALQLM